MWVKILKSVAKYAAKGIKYVVKIAGKTAGNAVTKAMVATGNAIVKYPKIAAGIIAAIEGTRAVKDLVDEWISETKSNKFAEDLQAYIDTLIKEGIDPKSVTVEQVKTESPSAQHPTFYFKDSDMYSIQTTDDMGMGDNTRFRYGVIRHLTIGKPLLAGDNSFLDYVLPATTTDMLFAAYTTFYARLGLQAPNSATTLRNNIATILYYSNLAYALVKDAQRFYSGKNVNFNGDDNAVLYMLGGDMVTISKSSAGLMTLTGCSYKPVDQGLNYSAYYTNSAHGLVGRGAYDDYYPVVPNIKWVETVSKLKKLPVSDNVAGFWDYFLGGVFRDLVDEDEYEYYTFHPCQISGLKGPAVPIATSSDGNSNVATQSWLNQFNFAYSQVMDLINSDKAYVSILSYFGLIPTSSGVKPAFATTWRADDRKFDRDIMGKTFRFVDATDDLYRSLCNARYYVYTPDQSGTGMYKWTDFAQRDIALGRGGETMIAFGKRVAVRPGYQSKEVFPTLTSVRAGEIASAVKFAGPMALYVGPIAYYGEGGFAFKSPHMQTWASTFLPTVTITSSVEVTKDMAIDMADFGQDSVLPLYLRPFARLGMDVDASDVQYMYRPTQQFDIVRVVDKGTAIFDFLYVNMLMGTNQLKDVNEVLDKLMVYYGVNA